MSDMGYMVIELLLSFIVAGSFFNWGYAVGSRKKSARK